MCLFSWWLSWFLFGFFGSLIMMWDHIWLLYWEMMTGKGQVTHTCIPTPGDAEREGNKSPFCICSSGGHWIFLIYKCILFHQIRGTLRIISSMFFFSFPTLFLIPILHIKRYGIVLQFCLRLGFPLLPQPPPHTHTPCSWDWKHLT